MIQSDKLVRPQHFGGECCGRRPVLREGRARGHRCNNNASRVDCSPVPDSHATVYFRLVDGFDVATGRGKDAGENVTRDNSPCQTRSYTTILLILTFATVLETLVPTVNGS
jgi:hypothetical protein